MRTRGLTGVPAPVLVLGAIVSVQFGSAIARTMFDDVSPLGVTFLRQALAALVLLAITRPAVQRWTRRQWVAVSLYGAALAGMNAAFYSALQYIPLGVAVTIEFLGPLALALAMTRRWRDAVWALVAAAGVVLLGAGAQGSASMTGLLLALLAGAFWAAYILTSAKVGLEFPGLDGLAVALVIASVLTAPFGAASAMVVFTDPSLLARGLAVALLSSILVYGLEMAALRRMSARVFSVMLSLEPAVAALAGFVVLGQLLTGTDIVGLVLVSIASAAVAYSSKERRLPLEPLE